MSKKPVINSGMNPRKQRREEGTARLHRAEGGPTMTITKVLKKPTQSSANMPHKIRPTMGKRIVTSLMAKVFNKKK